MTTFTLRLTPEAAKQFNMEVGKHAFSYDMLAKAVDHNYISQELEYIEGLRNKENSSADDKHWLSFFPSSDIAVNTSVLADVFNIKLGGLTLSEVHEFNADNYDAINRAYLESLAKVQHGIKYLCSSRSLFRFALENNLSDLFDWPHIEKISQETLEPVPNPDAANHEYPDSGVSSHTIMPMATFLF